MMLFVNLKQVKFVKKKAEHPKYKKTSVYKYSQIYH